MAQPLDGVVAYVDVTNWDGANAGGWVVKRLQSLGASVVDRLTKNLTHCVFKGTDADLRSLHDRVAKLGPFPPLIVKPDWATACGNEGRRALERPYMLTRPPDTVQSLMKSPSLGTGKKRRRSMQPLPLAAYGAQRRIDLPRISPSQCCTALETRDVAFSSLAVVELSLRPESEFHPVERSPIFSQRASSFRRVFAQTWTWTMRSSRRPSA